MYVKMWCARNVQVHAKIQTTMSFSVTSVRAVFEAHFFRPFTPTSARIESTDRAQCRTASTSKTVHTTRHGPFFSDGHRGLLTLFMHVRYFVLMTRADGYLTRDDPRTRVNIQQFTMRITLRCHSDTICPVRIQMCSVHQAQQRDLPESNSQLGLSLDTTDTCIVHKQTNRDSKCFALRPGPSRCTMVLALLLSVWSSIVNGPAVWCSSRCFTYNASMQPFVIALAS